MKPLHELMQPMILDEYVLVMKELFGWDRSATVRWIDTLDNQDCIIPWLHHDKPMDELQGMMIGSSQVTKRTAIGRPFLGLPCRYRMIEVLEAGLSGSESWRDVRRAIEDIEREFGIEFIPLIREK